MRRPWLASQKCASCYVRVRSHLARSDPSWFEQVSVQERVREHPRVLLLVLGHPCQLDVCTLLGQYLRHLTHYYVYNLHSRR